MMNNNKIKSLKIQYFNFHKDGSKNLLKDTDYLIDQVQILQEI